MIRRILTRPLGAAIVLFGLTACEQGEGEACQVERDCAEGLECVRGQGVEHGTCEPIGSVDDDEADAATDAAAMEDAAAEDAAAMEDAAAEDAATEDAAVDAAMQDAAADASSDEDAGS